MKIANELKKVRIGHGLRERLLLSFIAISGFALVAAVVANYAFYAIGQSLQQVTEKSVPPAIAALELAQRAERDFRHAGGCVARETYCGRYWNIFVPWAGERLIAKSPGIYYVGIDAEDADGEQSLEACLRATEDFCRHRTRGYSPF